MVIKMNNASKTALGAMSVALSVILLMPTALELFVYALPALAGIITMFCVVELNKKWAFAVFTASAIISLVLVPNKEAAVLYAAFFGYYPILKALLENTKFKAVEYIFKFSVFNLSVFISYFLLIKVFGMPFEELMGTDESKWFIYVFPIMFNLMFIVYDLYLTKMYTLYIRVWQKKFHKMFRFK